MKSLSIIR